MIDLPGDTWQIGTSYVIAQSGPEADPVLIDMETGREFLLHETPPGALQALNVAPHPSRDQVAMLETRFPAGCGRVESTLFLISTRGETLRSLQIPWEAYSPVWLDEERLLVQAYDFNDWERSFAYLFDTSSGETTVVEGWRATYAVADETTMYGVDGAHIVTADIAGGSVETLETLPSSLPDRSSSSMTRDPLK